MPYPSTRRLLVTGATTPLGRRVAELLLRSAEVSVTTTSRTPGQLADLAARGAQVRRADFDDPASLDAAFAGAEGLLLVRAGFPGTDGLRRHRAAVEAAVRAGVRHIACTSVVCPDPASPLGQEHVAAEAAIEGCGIPCTILRLAPLAESLFCRIPLALRVGHWPSSAGAGRVAYVARDDAAAAAAAAMNARMAERQRLDLTGPEALTPAEVVAACNAVFGAGIGLVPLDDGSLAGDLAAAGMAAALVKQAVEMGSPRFQCNK
ncbi:NAD(P)H-binding protein [Paracidovorax wautersii]|jgi:NAD(P)H dehydrogenase (quinone)|uniref:NAD(P)H dehydrogenase (Quinone) n=1 Tax=Paracidovorax wautersii TaxID=1177982 RepID=A0A1I2DZR7_9BURK|nr:NAD(P)H-binding protein [Paracidovorax wautersii]GAO20757.1 hypothetical protein ALISP_0577 [Alicycliphilus sp. B1]SFE86065.1 NAD(P)H dehydrogenase (quinone) [Paracidovorax wautersii]